MLFLSLAIFGVIKFEQPLFSINKGSLILRLVILNSIDSVIIEADGVSVLEDADAIVILTEWFEFAEIEWELAYKMMRKPGWVFDSRSIVKSRDVLKANLNLWRIGDGFQISELDKSSINI